MKPIEINNALALRLVGYMFLIICAFISIVFRATGMFSLPMTLLLFGGHTIIGAFLIYLSTHIGVILYEDGLEYFSKPYQKDYIYYEDIGDVKISDEGCDIYDSKGTRIAHLLPGSKNYKNGIEYLLKKIEESKEIINLDLASQNIDETKLHE